MGAFKTRDFHQRRMEQIKSNIDVCLEYLREFIDIYQPAHPTLAKSALSIAQILISCQDALDTLKNSF